MKNLTSSIQLLNKNIINNHIKYGSVFVLSVVDSTNQYLLNCVDNLNSGDVCIAEYQQAGRGRRGRKWFSSFGNNLCLSMYWYLKKGINATIGLSLVISVVIAKVLEDFGVGQVKLKWPNDLYIFNRKLAGVLVELIAKRDGTAQIVIGLGINLNIRNMHLKEIKNNWINLQEIGIIIDRNELAIKLIKELRISLKLFEEKGCFPFIAQWNMLDIFMNLPVKLIINNNKICGIAHGINEQGAILLEQNGIIKPWIGEEISLCKRINK